MTLSVRRHAVAMLLFLVSSSVMLGADQEKQNWLRASGKDLQICLKGEIFESGGAPANGVDISGSLNVSGATRAIEPKVDGHRFEVWIPVNKVQWHSMWIRAASTDRQRVASTELNAFELRQAAVEGIKLTLQAPSRSVAVKVVHNGQPVSGSLVKAELGFGIGLRARTDPGGVARFGLLPDESLQSLTAWTDDFRIGGFGFGRKPSRDPNANEHVVELSVCRDELFRFVDEAGSPVPGVDFQIQMATAAPNFNYIGTNEHSRMTTNSAGEVLYRWFPDWDNHHFYVELDSDHWVINGDKESVKGVTVFKLKKRKNRKQVHGNVVSTSTGVGGFYVSLRSFQGEQDNTLDVVSTFSDADGKFSVDVLPDATYFAYVLDARWVGQIIDLIPYQSESDKITPPQLPVSEGQEVEVIVTTGPQKKPYRNLTLNLRREHRYTWREDGGTRSGNGGPQWWATTDESGRATIRTLPGLLKVSVHTPFWRAEEKVDVRSGENAKIELHREVEEKRKVSGRLVRAKGMDSNLANAEIHVGSVDTEYDDQQKLSSNQDGSFTFETLSAEIGVFGYTQDGRAAGSIIVKDLESPVELRLRPTMDYHGQLLGEGDRPLAGHGVRAIIRVEGDGDDVNSPFGKNFEAKRIEAKTDSQGNFKLTGIPSEMKAFIYADAIDDTTDSTFLGDIYLEAGESRPPTVSRLGKSSNAASDISLAQQFEVTLRDCSLLGFHVMVIAASDGGKATEFVNENFINYERNKHVASFMQIILPHDQATLKPADAKFLDERNLRIPGEDRVFACALDSEGHELGRVEIDVRDEGAIKRAADFIQQHMPAPVDAEKKWQEAFAEASGTNRRVWARVSQRYCGPCFRMARWLDDQSELLQKDYVMLKIDDVRDQNGVLVAEKLRKGKQYGIPFHAIFDQNEAMLVDSAGPLGNIGHPSGFEGKKHLRKMLLDTRQNLTDAEIGQLIESLED